jgi:hypothetical protein
VFAGPGRTPDERFRVESRSTSIDLIRRAFGAPRTKAGLGSERTPASTIYASPCVETHASGSCVQQRLTNVLCSASFPCECSPARASPRRVRLVRDVHVTFAWKRASAQPASADAS